MRYFKILNDVHGSEVEAYIWHGYKEGQILRAVDGTCTGEHVELQGPSKIAWHPTDDTYSQCVYLRDLVELEVVSLEDLREGDKLYTLKDLKSNVNCVISADGEFTLEEIDMDSEHRYMAKWACDEFGGSETSQWFLVGDFEKATLLREVDTTDYLLKGGNGIRLLQSIEQHKAKQCTERFITLSVDTEDTQAYTVETEAKEVKPRVKVIYEVQLNGFFMHRTKSRKKAREIKALLGGKDAGAIIMQYVAVKEVR